MYLFKDVSTWMEIVVMDAWDVMVFVMANQRKNVSKHFIWEASGAKVRFLRQSLNNF